MTPNPRTAPAERRRRDHFGIRFDALPDGVVETGLDGRVLDANLTFCDMVGWSRDEVVGTDMPYPWWPEPYLLERVAAAASSSQLPEGEHNLWFQHCDGHRFPVGVNVAVLHDDRFEPTGMLSVVKDFTERAVVEYARREAESRYRLLADNSGDYIAVVDAELRLVYASPAVERILGYKPEELEGEVQLRLVHPDDLPSIVAARDSGAALEAPFRAEYRLRHRDGHYVWVETVGRTLPPERPGARPLLQTAHREITERKRIEEELRRSEERFRGAVEAMLDGLIVYRAVRDDEGRLVDLMTEYANEQVAVHGGPHPAEQVGRTLREVVPSLPADRWEHYRRAVEDRVPAMYEAEITRVGGTEHYEVQVVPSGDGCVMTLRNITERRATEAALRQRESALARLEADHERERLAAALVRTQRLEGLGRLAGGLAHDFNNVLGIVNNAAASIRGRVDTDAIAPDLDAITASIEHASTLTRRLLQLGSHGGSAREHADVARVVDGVIAVVGGLLGPSVETELAVELDLLVHVPTSELEQVLLNLLINARDAMPVGGRIGIAAKHSFVGAGEAAPLGIAPGEYVVVAVSDEGVGIDDAAAARVFEPFFTTKPRDEGSGLGLVTVREIVTRAGGAVTLSNRSEGGAVARVLLPALRAAEPPVSGGRVR